VSTARRGLCQRHAGFVSTARRVCVNRTQGLCQPHAGLGAIQTGVSYAWSWNQCWASDPNVAPLNRAPTAVCIAPRRVCVNRTRVWCQSRIRGAAALR